MPLATQSVGIRQRKVIDHCFVVDGTGTAAISEGKWLGSLTDNGTGDYTVTLDEPGQRASVVVGCVPLVANLQVQLVSQTAAAVRVKFTDNSGTATDTAFNLTIRAFYAKEQS